MEKNITIKGARENNLKNVNVTIPKDALVVFTGLSGSGKSTLAFDTLYAEGQRRYMESLSSYARQFLGNYEKPDVDVIDGLSPSIAIDQKSVSHNPRSTVGTVTEIYDYLRLLFGRVGIPYCPIHHEPIVSFSVTNMTDIVLSYPEGTKIQLLSPVVHKEKGTHKEILDKIKANGFVRLRVDDVFTTVEELKPLDKNKKHDIDLVVDRIIVKAENRSRIFESIETALDWSHGLLVIYSDIEEKVLSDRHTCPICGFSVPKLEPRLFSFNAPMGFCPDCRGLGIKREADPALLVPNPELSISQGAIDYYKNTVGTQNLEWQEFKMLCDLYSVPTDIPFKDLSEKQKQILFIGSPEIHKYQLKSSSGNVMNRLGYIEGVKSKVERLYGETSSDFMRDYYEKFMRDSVCTTCNGARLNKEALSVLIDNKNIFQVTCMQLGELKSWINSLKDKLKDNDLAIANMVIREIDSRVTFLCDVGLDYLTLSRMAMTLSGGESQRIRLATQVGSKLTGILYVLDEPSIGLHQKDDERLIKTLKEMRDIGNTLVVVEHDEETIRQADYIVDIGPRAGIHGGEIIYSGDVPGLLKCENSLTADYLTGRKKIEVPSNRRKGNGKFIELKGCKVNNLKNINVKFPLGTFIAVTGVSGSGKSSLVNQTLYLQLQKYFTGKEVFPGEVKSFSGFEYVDKVVNVSQEPIGRTPRSNPATYIKLFDEIRDLFANTVEAKARGFDKGRFSFNVTGGRCEKCEGAGVTRVPMNFLPDVYVKCLEMTVEDALSFFSNHPKIKNKIQILYDVGLGYIKLGQAATTLSGGEAQRVKLAYELQRKPTGKTLYLLDEPTTGLHSHDVKQLIAVLQRIVDHGDTVIVIEHNLDVIKVVDHIIDIGPDGGDKGGKVVATGTPEEVSNNKSSYTGEYLKKVLGN